MSNEQGDGDAGSPGSARKLADILREAGVSSTGAGGRRRRPDDTPDAIEVPEVAQPATSVGGVGSDYRSDYSSDASGDLSGEFTSEFSGEFSSDFRSLSAYLLSDSRPPAAPLALARPAGNPAPPAQTPEIAPIETVIKAPSAQVAPRTDTGPLTPFGWAAGNTGWPESPGGQANSSSASPSIAVKAAPVQEPVSKVLTEPATGSSSTSHANRSPSPLASGAPAEEDEDDDTAVAVRAGAGSWAILAVELLAALGLGVAAWYAFSALWELLPYVAAFAGPVVVTGLVAIAGALRARTGRNPLGLPTLCLLVLAGTILVVLPAATVIVP